MVRELNQLVQPVCLPQNSSNSLPALFPPDPDANDVFFPLTTKCPNIAALMAGRSRRGNNNDGYCDAGPKAMLELR